MGTLDDFVSFLQGASNSAASMVSAPVDGINWALGKVGLPVSKKPVGGSEWLREVGFTAEPKNRNAGLLGEAVGGVIPIVAQAKAPQIAAGLNRVAANAAAPRTLHPQTGAIVWHGSPHKFDKFDSSKIGTGEGAQAYGHGLYLAESQDVAKTYQNLKPITDQTDGGFIQARAAFDIGKGNVKKALKWLDDRASSVQKNAQFLTDGGASEISQIERARELLKSGALQPGNMYRVDLPDEQIAKMLDWDKPLSQQAPEVQQTLKSLVDDIQSGGFDLSRGNRDLRKAFNPVTREQVLQEIATEYPHLKVVDGGLVEKSGRKIPDVAITEWMQNKHGAGYQDAGQLYRDLAHIVGSDAQVSATLKNNGIPGIRYLDGGSRGAGGGTSNFVVFPGNEGLLSILERNGQPLR